MQCKLLLGLRKLHSCLCTAWYGTCKGCPLRPVRGTEATVTHHSLQYVHYGANCRKARRKRVLVIALSIGPPVHLSTQTNRSYTHYWCRAGDPALLSYQAAVTSFLRCSNNAKVFCAEFPNYHESAFCTHAVPTQHALRLRAFHEPPLIQ